VGATTDPGRIRRWWSRWPETNIGIPTGERSGLLVLDIDDHGFTSLDALEEEHGPLPETLTVRTGGGGMHLYLKYPPGSGIRNSAGKVGLGLDVRGEGGYVVAPPSRTDKGPYASLDRLPRAEPPEWLLEAARGPHRAATDEDGTEAGRVEGLDAGSLEPIPKGERGDTLFRIACSLRARGCEYARILSELRRVNRERCSPPIGAHPEDTDAGELEKIAGGVVSRYPAGDATPEPDPDVLRNVEALYAGVLERLEWTGRGGPTDRAVYAALLITARRHGQAARGGVKVYLSVRALALASGVSKKTATKALDRLRAAKLVYRASEGKGAKAGALFLRVTQGVDTQPHGGGSEDSGLPLRKHLRELLRLRWGPGRAGKTRALYLDVIARAEHGEATLSEMAARTGRRRYDVRRALQMLLEPAPLSPHPLPLVECSGETYRLAPEFAAALDNELEATGIKRAERLDRQKYEREREIYRERLIRRRNRIPEVWPSTGRAGEPEPDGFTEDLQRVEAEPVEVFAPEVTDHTDPDQFRELAALIRSEVEARRAANPLSASDLARRHLDRLRKERPEAYARHRREPRKLSWEIAGLGWTRTVYSHDTITRALSELEPVEAAA
jgi:DNA-binding transcriptional ArsR family regulator